MRKKNTVLGCLSLGFLIHRHVCIEPIFLPDQKTLRERYRKVFINHYSFPAAASACPPN